MIQVKLNETTGDIELRFKYNTAYISRLKAIGGCVYKPEEKIWSVSELCFYAVQEEFKGELMYLTPEWQITGGTPPDYSSIYNQVSKITPSLKAPYKPYPFQNFGCNFLATMAIKYGFSCLFDDMGTGRY